MNAALILLLKYLWGIFGIYWIGVARGGKVSQTGESRISRPLRWGILAITFTLLFSPWTGVWVLGKAIFPPISIVADAGFVLTLAGLALAVWARVRLGRFWSDKVVLKVDHQLIREGPYAFVRHPIYSGVLLAVAGTALVVNQWRAAIAFFVLCTTYLIKAKKEERLLANKFGEQFRDHQRHTGFLIPRLRN